MSSCLFLILNLNLKCSNLKMRTFENIRVCGIRSENTIKGEFVITLGLFVEVAHLLLSAFEEELVVVLLRIEDKHLTVDDFNNIPGTDRIPLVKFRRWTISSQ